GRRFGLRLRRALLQAELRDLLQQHGVVLEAHAALAQRFLGVVHEAERDVGLDLFEEADEIDGDASGGRAAGRLGGQGSGTQLGGGRGGTGRGRRRRGPRRRGFRRRSRLGGGRRRSGLRGRRRLRRGSGLRGRGSRPGRARRWRRRRRRRGSGLVERELLFHAEADLLRGRLRCDGGVERRLVEPDRDVFLRRGCGGRFLVDERRREVLPRRQLLVQVQALFVSGCRRRLRLVDRDRDVLLAAERDLLFVPQRELLLLDDGRGSAGSGGARGSGRGGGGRPGRGSRRLGGARRAGHVLLRLVFVFLRGRRVALEPEDLGQGQALLGRLGRKALLRVDLAQLLARLQVVGEPRHHGLELIGGLVD